MKKVSHKNLYVRDPETGEFQPLMAIRGESAYDIAVRLGKFTGTEEEWANMTQNERDAAIQAIQKKGAETLASIPDDYTALAEAVEGKFDKANVAQELGDSEEKVLSQSGAKKAFQTIFGGNMLLTAKFRPNYYYSRFDNYGTHEHYDLFVVPVENGVEYTISPILRYISSETECFFDVSEDGPILDITTFTPTFTGDLYLTVYHSLLPQGAKEHEWFMCKTADIEKNGGLFRKNFLAQKLGSSDKTPISQEAVTKEFEAVEVLIKKTETNVNNFFTSNNHFSFGEIVNGAYFGSGEEVAYERYMYFKYVPVKANTTYYSNVAMRFVGFFNGEKQYLEQVENATEFTPTADGFANITIEQTAFDGAKLGETNNFDSILPIGVYNVALYEHLNAKIKNAEEKATQAETELEKVKSGNILCGKKWYACGDSFTEWSTETFNVSDYPNITGKSYYKTYPFFIGVRNNMQVYNSAVSGQTMATPATGEFTNCFSNELYKQIPADTDYITLWFGINDSHHRQGSAGGDGEDNTGVIPLGTINDTTTATFYGAWNVVMEYLLENHPYAHIGIIISNGCETTEYPTAEIEIAKKWGVAYLDLNGDYQVPMMHRTNGRSETCERAQELRKNAFWTSDTNGHPNTKAHEYQSTFIENWLRSL